MMNLSTPVVAIITPYYNTGVIFHETARSVFAQTMADWEWVIVNDGSTNQFALTVLDAYRVCDARVRVIDQSNRGLPAARNAGVAATRAPLLFFLDSDDVLAHNALERLVSLISNNQKIAFATSWVEAFGAKSFIWQHGFDSEQLFLFENTVTPLSMVRRTVCNAVGGFNEQRTTGLEDYEFWIRCAAAGYWGCDINEILLFQRHKRPDEYIHYRWANRDEPAKFRAFQDEMRRCYPTLYREGVPHLRATGEHPTTYARDRLGLWAFPLTRWLRTQKYQVTNSLCWRMLGSPWRYVKSKIL